MRMMSVFCDKWFRLSFKPRELRLQGTLNGGQSFRWKQVGGEWIGVFNAKLWIIKENDAGLDFQVRGIALDDSSAPAVKRMKHIDKNSVDEDSYIEELSSYFQLDVDLNKHYAEWCAADPRFESIAKDFYGIRVLKQDVIENVFSFICSSNNNISRITSMVEKLATFYGRKICTYNDEAYYAFPTAEQLNCTDIEKHLRLNGFGYRAKYIAETSKIICERGGSGWVEKLKSKSYAEAKTELLTLLGIGAKVADCICLMSLGHLDTIPVDTHVYQIAARHYMPDLPTRTTVTQKVYAQIGDHFRTLYGPLAGWAQTVLFCADLKKLQEKKKA